MFIKTITVLYNRGLKGKRWNSEHPQLK